MANFKTLIRNPRVLILLACILLALVAIAPQPFDSGVAIRGIEKGSAAELAGMVSPAPEAKPVTRERVLSINNRNINTPEEFERIVKDLEYNRTASIKTSKQTYRITPLALLQTETLNETITYTVTEQRNLSNGSIEYVNRSVTEPRTVDHAVGTRPLGLTVFPAPRSNIRTGLDLQGGTRVLLAPEKKLPRDDLNTLISSMKQRLNVYGLSDLTVRDASDLSGNQFILVEIAGVSEADVQNLLAKQGKFEAKIGNDTVFVGGKDITFVCRSAECSGIDPNAGCSFDGTTNFCRFQFAISITQDAAQRQADLTSKLDIIPGGPGRQSYLSKPIDLYLDDELVDSLQIGSDLRGSPTTSIAISGSGSGPDTRSATTATLQEMHRLQTVLITGSLPIKLSIVKTDTISSSLGEQFLRNALMIFGISVLAVALILIVVYRNLAIAIPICVAMVCEIGITMGIAAFIGWNIDLAAVAGIIAAVGTGVNDQIVITDELIRGGKGKHQVSWKDRMKNAFFIVFGAYLTITVAMLPLIFAGAGLLKGFAITTILAVSVGVLITRPAYAVIIETILEK